MFFFVVPSEDTKIRRPELLDKLGTEEMTILFREAYGILHNEEAAYDVLDSALVKALWRNPPHGENRLLYWMVQLVQSEAYAYHKRFSLRAWWTRAKRCPRKPPYNGAAQYLAIRARKNARLRAEIPRKRNSEHANPREKGFPRNRRKTAHEQRRRSFTVSPHSEKSAARLGGGYPRTDLIALPLIRTSRKRSAKHPGRAR